MTKPITIDAEKILGQFSNEELIDVLASRGRVVDLGSNAPDEPNLSIQTGRCLSCRFFYLESSYKTGRGECRIGRPATEGFPTVRAGAWCGEWKARFANQTDFNEPPVRADDIEDVFPSMLIAYGQIEARLRKIYHSFDNYSRYKMTSDDVKYLVRMVELGRGLGHSPEHFNELLTHLEQPMPLEVERTLRELAQ